jgi:chemotaxis family two-component system response regulator Rcp1
MLSIDILLVEDNEGDIVLTLEALNDARISNKVSVIKDGDAAINYLQKSKEGLEPMPDLVLLDINLPKVDGKEVLTFIKTDDMLKKIPVVMLTTSSSENDISDAYSNHANCYITKPVDFNKFFEIIKAIEDFWITIVKLPPKN